MLGKLLKYEMRSTSRFMWILYGAVIVMGLITALVLRLDIALSGGAVVEDGYISAETTNTLQAVLTFISVSLYALLLIAMEVLTLVMIVLRFWKNLLGGEGYLMHTLPVPTWMLVTSKLIIAFFWEVLAFITAMISGSIILSVSGVWKEMFGNDSFREIFRQIFEGMGVNINIVKFILIVLFAALAGILQFYFSMAIGNLANKNKILFSVLAFIGINVVVSIIRSLITVGRMAVMGVFSGNANITGFDLSDWPTLIFQAVLAVGFFFGTYLIMENKLNLE